MTYRIYTPAPDVRYLTAIRPKVSIWEPRPDRSLLLDADEVIAAVAQISFAVAIQERCGGCDGTGERELRSRRDISWIATVPCYECTDGWLERDVESIRRIVAAWDRREAS